MYHTYRHTAVDLSACLPPTPTATASSCRHLPFEYSLITTSRARDWYVGKHYSFVFVYCYVICDRVVAIIDVIC